MNHHSLFAQSLDASRDALEERVNLADTTIHALFEQQVCRTPDALAVLFEAESLTYRALNAQANQLAHYLRAQMAVQSGDRVALMVERSPRMIVGLLAILKAGAAYVPIDVRHPAPVIADMLQETSVKAILLDTEFYLSVLDIPAALFLMDDELDDLTTPTTNLSDKLGESCTPQDLAYVIYTSGSTGKRKGVALEHQAVVNTLRWRQAYYDFGPTDVTLQLPSVAFDSSVVDIFTMLIAGGRLVIPLEAARMEPRYLTQLILTHGVTHFLITPALYKLLLEQLGGQATALRSVTVAGEATTPSLVQTHYACLPTVALINEYGPTENAVCSTACRLCPDDERVAIGLPIWQVKLYLLDEQLQPVPDGVKGEIYLAGKGLARGYFNQPGLTADRFLLDPFVTPAGRMYKTGDIGSRRSDGQIDFWGRADNQVKIRGFRIELGEIEQALLQHPAVHEAVVLCTEEREEGGEALDKQLCAFVVSHCQPDVALLRNDLCQSLPHYMIPDTFVLLDQIPLNVNGKVDRKALWARQSSQGPMESQLVLPRNEIEATLAQIWAKALEQQTVSVVDDFFTLGGNSLRAVKTVEMIYKQLGVEVSVVELYVHHTIEMLAHWLTNEGVAVRV